MTKIIKVNELYEVYLAGAGIMGCKSIISYINQEKIIKIREYNDYTDNSAYKNSAKSVIELDKGMAIVKETPEDIINLIKGDE